VSGSGSVWLGCPDESLAVTLMLYGAAVTVFGMLTVINRLVGALALIATGLDGVITHCPEMALESQIALIEPA
jgi:hypothetical protein